MMTDSSYQLSLFDSLEQPAPFPTAHTDISGISWSYSRRDAFEWCPRAYYYTYFGASKRSAEQEAQKAQIQFLKGLSSRHLHVGDIVHRVINTTLKKA